MGQGFPLETWNVAKKIASEFDSYLSVMEKVTGLFERKLVQFRSSTTNSFEHGNFGCYLHEIYDYEIISGDCVTFAGAINPILSCLGAGPRLYATEGANDIGGSNTYSGSVKFSHMFNTVEFNGYEHLFDPYLSLYGKIIQKNDSFWVIEDYRTKEVTYRYFENLRELSEYDFSELIEARRNPKMFPELFSGYNYIGNNYYRFHIDWEKERVMTSTVRDYFFDLNLLPKFDIGHMRLQMEIPLVKGKMQYENAVFIMTRESKKIEVMDERDYTIERIKMPYQTISQRVDKLIDSYWQLVSTFGKDIIENFLIYPFISIQENKVRKLCSNIRFEHEFGSTFSSKYRHLINIEEMFYSSYNPKQKSNLKEFAVQLNEENTSGRFSKWISNSHNPNSYDIMAIAKAKYFMENSAALTNSLAGSWIRWRNFLETAILLKPGLINELLLKEYKENLESMIAKCL